MNRKNYINIYPAHVLLSSLFFFFVSFAYQCKSIIQVAKKDLGGKRVATHKHTEPLAASDPLFVSVFEYPLCSSSISYCALPSWLYTLYKGRSTGYCFRSQRSFCCPKEREKTRQQYIYIQNLIDSRDREQFSLRAVSQLLQRVSGEISKAMYGF